MEMCCSSRKECGSILSINMPHTPFLHLSITKLTPSNSTGCCVHPLHSSYSQDCIWCTQHPVEFAAFSDGGANDVVVTQAVTKQNVLKTVLTFTFHGGLMRFYQVLRELLQVYLKPERWVAVIFTPCSEYERIYSKASVIGIGHRRGWLAWDLPHSLTRCFPGFEDWRR